jgi:peptidoglycan/LPS O-acetylase OafA/YrhL
MSARTASRWGVFGAMLNWKLDQTVIEQAARRVLIILLALLTGFFLFFGYRYYSNFALQKLGTVGGTLAFAMLGPFYLAVLIVARSGGLLTQILEIAPLRFVGRISYGLYLYHFPIFYWLDGHCLDLLSSSILIILKFAATVVVATLSYFLMERPLLKLKDQLFPRYKPTKAQPLDRLVTA